MAHPCVIAVKWHEVKGLNHHLKPCIHRVSENVIESLLGWCEMWTSVSWAHWKPPPVPIFIMYQLLVSVSWPWDPDPVVLQQQLKWWPTFSPESISPSPLAHWHVSPLYHTPAKLAGWSHLAGRHTRSVQLHGLLWCPHENVVSSLW